MGQSTGAYLLPICLLNNTGTEKADYRPGLVHVMARNGCIAKAVHLYYRSALGKSRCDLNGANTLVPSILLVAIKGSSMRSTTYGLLLIEGLVIVFWASARMLLSLRWVSVVACYQLNESG